MLPNILPKPSYTSYNKSRWQDLVERCGGEIVVREVASYYGRTRHDTSIIPPTEWKPKEDIYFEIDSTATKGTIGRLKDIELISYGDDRYSQHYGTLILEIDGRPRPSRINFSYAKELHGYTGATKYVRTVNKHGKKEVKDPVNKYKQPMKEGQWVAGLLTRKRFGVGTITRWTNHNVWINLNGIDGNERKLDSIDECLVLDNSDEMQGVITWATLKGYDGR